MATTHLKNDECARKNRIAECYGKCNYENNEDIKTKTKYFQKHFGFFLFSFKRTIKRLFWVLYEKAFGLSNFIIGKNG